MKKKKNIYIYMSSHVVTDDMGGGGKAGINYHACMLHFTESSGRYAETTTTTTRNI